MVTWIPHFCKLETICSFAGDFQHGTKFDDELIIAWMSYNCCFVNGHYSVCYQDDYKLGEKLLWSPWHWLCHLCWQISLNCTGLKHSLCIHPSTCLLSFQNVGSVSTLVSIVMKSFLCIFLFPSKTNALECLQNQECLCQASYTFAKVLGHNIPALAEKPT